MMAWAAAQNDPAVSLSQQQNIAHHVLALITSGLPAAAYDMDTFILVTAANPAGIAHIGTVVDTMALVANTCFDNGCSYLR